MRKTKVKWTLKVLLIGCVQKRPSLSIWREKNGWKLSSALKLSLEYLVLFFPAASVFLKLTLNLPIIHHRLYQVSMNISTQIMDLFALHQNDSKDSFIQYNVLVLDISLNYKNTIQIELRLKSSLSRALSNSKPKQKKEHLARPRDVGALRHVLWVLSRMLSRVLLEFTLALKHTIPIHRIAVDTQYFFRFASSPRSSCSWSFSSSVWLATWLLSCFSKPQWTTQSSKLHEWPWKFHFIWTWCYPSSRPFQCIIMWVYQTITLVE